MYYIYHIPGVKIGCTTRLEKRMKEQHSTNWELLETHLDIELASIRELELQKQYGYKLDTKPYFKVSNMATKEGRSKGGKLGGKISKPNIEACRKGGLIGGATNVINGTLKQASIISLEKTEKPIEVYDLIGNFIYTYKSISEASRQLQLNQSLVSAVLNGRRNKHKGYTFKYKI